MPPKRQLSDAEKRRAKKARLLASSAEDCKSLTHFLTKPKYRTGLDENPPFSSNPAEGPQVSSDLAEGLRSSSDLTEGPGCSSSGSLLSFFKTTPPERSEVSHILLFYNWNEKQTKSGLLLFRRKPYFRSRPTTSLKGPPTLPKGPTTFLKGPRHCRRGPRHP